MLVLKENIVSLQPESCFHWLFICLCIAVHTQCIHVLYIHMGTNCHNRSFIPKNLKMHNLISVFNRWYIVFFSLSGDLVEQCTQANVSFECLLSPFKELMGPGMGGIVKRTMREIIAITQTALPI